MLTFSWKREKPGVYVCNGGDDAIGGSIVRLAKDDWRVYALGGGIANTISLQAGKKMLEAALLRVSAKKTAVKHSHCGWCGSAFAPEQPWPRLCADCGQTSYLNPAPVAVLLLPVDDGLIVVRRGIEPRKGQLALPGGFINLGESWQAAAARELEEETGVAVLAEEVSDFRTLSAPDGTVLIFGLASPRRRGELPPFRLCEETEEVSIITAPAELAFPLHSRVVADYFARTRTPVRS